MTTEAIVIPVRGALTTSLARAADHLLRHPTAALVFDMGDEPADSRTGATVRGWMARHDDLLRGARGVVFVVRGRLARWTVRIDLASEPPPGRWAVRSTIEGARSWLAGA